MPKYLNSGVVVNGSTPGKYYDTKSTGLYLLIRDNGGKQWKQRLTIKGRRRELGLGSPPLISLKEARAAAIEHKKAAREGRDIIAERRQEKRASIFSEVASRRHKDLNPTWKNPKHGDQWINTLKRYVFPFIGTMDIASVQPSDIRKILMQETETGEAFWHAKAETARRVRQRMEDVFHFAVAMEMRNDNPVSKLTKSMPNQGKKVKPRRSLPYYEVADAIMTIRNSRSWPSTTLAFEWMVLTATRSGETRGATWGEIDLERALWTIPAERMKIAREHRVPLSSRCIEIAQQVMATYKGGTPDPDDLLFPSMPGKILADMTLSKLMRENDIDAVPHGFRTSFRVWVQEQTNAPHGVAEAALAHTIPNKAEAAYARSDYLDKRRGLMQLWADYLAGKYDAELEPITMKKKQ